MSDDGECFKELWVLRLFYAWRTECFLLVSTDEEEEEEFLETLPTDMMEDDDLRRMAAMAQQASFITRDLSSW